MTTNDLSIRAVPTEDGSVLVVDETESVNFEWTFEDPNGVSISPSSFVSITMTVYQKPADRTATAVAINGIIDRDVNNTNQGTITGDVLTIRLTDPDDTKAVGAVDELHVIELTWRWVDATSTERGNQDQYEYWIRKQQQVA